MVAPSFISAGSAGAAGFAAAASLTSCSVILPPAPVPATVARSTPSSPASFFARGDAIIFRPSSLVARVSTDGCVAASKAEPLGMAVSELFSESIKLFGTFSSLSPRTKTGAPTGSVWSVSARICFTKPSAGDSISSVALSVSISKITSPFLTSSPTLTRQLTIVPSSIV